MYKGASPLALALLAPALLAPSLVARALALRALCLLALLALLALDADELVGQGLLDLTIPGGLGVASSTSGQGLVVVCASLPVSLHQMAISMVGTKLGQ